MTQDQYFRVVGWEDFQHYKHRDPPWIKLHRRLLDNLGWSRLSDVSKGHLVGIWLLASRHNNKVPFIPKWIATRIGATRRVDLKPLLELGFIEMVEDASTVIAPQVQSADSELETELEKSREETEGGAFEAAWAVYPKRPNNSKASARRAWMARVKAGVSPAVMLDGATRYAAFIAAQETDPKFVKLGSTFFGPDEHYLNDYTIQSTGKKVQTYVNDDGVNFTPEFLRAAGMSAPR